MPKRKASQMEAAASQHGKPPKRLEPVQEDQDEDEVEDQSDQPDEDEDGGDSDGSSAPEVSSYAEDSSDDDDGDDSEQEADGEKQLTSHFNARAAEEDDFHGLKKLLGNYLSGKDFSCSDLVDAIIRQQPVGMIVTSGEEEAGEDAEQEVQRGGQANGSTASASTSAVTGADDDGGRGSIWAVLTVLNTQLHKEKKFMQEIREYAMGLCKDAAAREELTRAWDTQGTGLLVSECVLGLPPRLAPPSLRALAEDLRQAAAEGASKEVRRAFKLKQFVLLPMVLVETGGAKGQAPGSSDGGIGPQQIFYMRPEHEFLHRHSSWSQLAHSHKAPRNDGFTEYRLLMVVGADKMAAVQRDLDAEIGDTA